jgi:hypothetical protein
VTSCRFNWTSVGVMTGASTKQVEVLVNLTLLFLLGQLAFGIKFARRSTHGVDSFKSFSLGFCSEWKLGCGVGFGVVNRIADAVEVDDFDGFCLYCCLRERS